MNTQFRFFFTIVLLITVTGNVNGYETKKKKHKVNVSAYQMLMTTPVITVKIDVSMSNYEVRINDVPIVTQKEGFPIVSRYNINHWIKSGKNELSVMIDPLPGENSINKNATSLVSLRVRKNGSHVDDNITICTLKYHGNNERHALGFADSSPAGKFSSKTNFSQSQDGDILISEISKNTSKSRNGIVLTRTVTMPLSLEEWKWFASDEIEYNLETKKQLYQQYQAIWIALNQKNIASILPLFKERIQEGAKSMYISEQKLFESLKDSLLEDANNSDKELWDTGWDDSELEIFGYGKLARLTDWEGRPYLAYTNKDNTSSSEYEVIFRKSGNKWIIAR